MPNQALAQKTLDLIRANRELFDMGWWANIPNGKIAYIPEDETKPTCGTALCAAGWASLAAGYRIKHSVDTDGEAYGDVNALDDKGEVVDPYSSDIEQTDWVTHGARLLDIPWRDASNLFSTVETHAERVLELIANGGDYRSELDYEPEGYWDDEDRSESW